MHLAVTALHKAQMPNIWNKKTLPTPSQYSFEQTIQIVLLGIVLSHGGSEFHQEAHFPKQIC